MIRRMNKNDIDEIMQIWYEENISAHSFIDEKYWEQNYEYVLRELPKAEVYVYEDNGKLCGFIGLTDNYIQGIFVRSDMQSKGIGTQLLNCVRNRNCLTLNVYARNKKAVRFYLRENFRIKSQETDECTGQKEYTMVQSKER